MHISDGALAAPVLIGGAGLTLAGVWLGLRRLDYDHMMTTAVLASVFFVGSLIHVPLGPSSVHLLLNGLAGMVLGWAAFPCILVALILQAVLFQFGGLTVLGVNTLNVALPAILCRYLLQGFLARGGRTAALCGFVGGAGAVLGTALMVALSLALSDEGFLPTARLVVLAHVPVMAIEGVVTMFAVAFLARTRPELLGIRSASGPEKGTGVALLSLLLVMACCLAMPGKAEAHKIMVNAWVEGEALLVETAFGDGSAGANAQVSVTDQVTGEVVLQGVADGDGLLRLALPQAVREAGHTLQILSNGGQGHQANCVISAEEFHPQSGAGSQESTQAAPEAAAVTSGLDVEAMRRLVRQEVAEAVQEQIQPLRRDLRALQQQGPRVADIVGGLGWILGLAGLAVLVRKPGRRKTDPPRA